MQKQMRSQYSRVVRRFTHVYLDTQTVGDAGDIRTWRTMFIFITGKLEDPNLSPHAGIKMVLGSPMHICGYGFTLQSGGNHNYDVEEAPEIFYFMVLEGIWTQNQIKYITNELTL